MSDTMTEHAIRVENLCKKYGPVLAVDHIRFEVKPGELVGFLGSNGAGKSTTMRVLTTFLPATAASPRSAADVMNDSMKVRENIGYLPRACRSTRKCASRNTSPSGQAQECRSFGSPSARRSVWRNAG